MPLCFCSGRCRELGYCPTTGATIPGQIQVGRTHREPLTEEQVRRIIREELKRAKGEA